jgi:hypothetical protein
VSVAEVFVFEQLLNLSILTELTVQANKKNVNAFVIQYPQILGRDIGEYSLIASLAQSISHTLSGLEADLALGTYTA